MLVGAPPLLKQGLARLTACYLRSSLPLFDVPQALLAGMHVSAAAEQTPKIDTGVAQIFDRALKVAHRDRAAFLRANSQREDPLQAEIAERLLDRLEDCRRGFPRAAVVGGCAESVARRLGGGRAGVREMWCLDTSDGALAGTRRVVEEEQARGIVMPELHCVVADEEFLPLKHSSVDVIISCLGLHWVNDVPGAMTQCRRALKPDGLFLSAMWGGNTLQELRIACMMGEEAAEGGVSQRVSPLAQVRDAGNLLTRAGLNIPSVDVDEITMQYRSPRELVDHLRTMGESNAVHVRRPRLAYATWQAIEAAYMSTLTDSERQAGSIPATFEAIYMTGWAPHDRQQRAMQRGTATTSFQDLERAVREPASQPSER